MEIESSSTRLPLVSGLYFNEYEKSQGNKKKFIARQGVSEIGPETHLIIRPFLMRDETAARIDPRPNNPT
jgi:hypothetical protein